MTGAVKILFVALGEAEVPAYEDVARRLEREGIVQPRVVTWLPRLASQQTESLESLRVGLADGEQASSVLARAGLAHLSMAADYDRDWHFASVSSKSTHVRRVFRALTTVFDQERPDLVVSSVGGETTRMVTEAIAVARNIPTAYFNAIPLPGRFVMLKSLAAPFVPYPGGDSGYLPRSSQVSQDPKGSLGQPPATVQVSEGISRVWSQFVKGEKTYPRSWIPRKARLVARDSLLKRLPTRHTGYSSAHDVKVLYPLHDERDFQVAVRERHAVPQSALLQYLSSTLPAGYHIYVKPHPEHSAAHHTILWRDASQRPNIHFLPLGMKGSEALDGADVVLTLASSMGFEAAERGKPVVCYGSPFYSRRGVTIDVSDPRDLAPAILEAREFRPPAEDVTALRQTMLDHSWEGRFTPLSLEVANLERLAGAVRDVVEQL